MVTWTLERLVNKPHIYKSGGVWRIILREGYDLQSLMMRRFDAERFCSYRNAQVYRERQLAKIPPLRLDDLGTGGSVREASFE